MTKCQWYSGLFSYVGKGTVVVVVVQTILAVVGHVKIRPAIVVVVADGASVAPAIIGYSGLFCHVGKCSVVIVVEERRVRAE